MGKNIHKVVCKVFKEVLDVDASRIVPEACIDDLGASTVLREIALRLMEELDVESDDGYFLVTCLNYRTTISDVEDFLQERILCRNAVRACVRLHQRTGETRELDYRLANELSVNEWLRLCLMDERYNEQARRYGWRWKIFRRGGVVFYCSEKMIFRAKADPRKRDGSRPVVITERKDGWSVDGIIPARSGFIPAGNGFVPVGYDHKVVVPDSFDGVPVVRFYEFDFSNHQDGCHG